MHLSRALGSLGYAQLVAGDAPGTVQPLRRVRELEESLGVTDPSRGRWQGDLAEALVRVGEYAEAQDFIVATRERTLRLGLWCTGPRRTEGQDSPPPDAGDAETGSACRPARSPARCGWPRAVGRARRCRGRCRRSRKSIICKGT